MKSSFQVVFCCCLFCLQNLSPLSWNNILYIGDIWNDSISLMGFLSRHKIECIYLSFWSQQQLFWLFVFYWRSSLTLLEVVWLLCAPKQLWNYTMCDGNFTHQTIPKHTANKYCWITWQKWMILVAVISMSNFVG